jgi:hypothetical protein
MLAASVAADLIDTHVSLIFTALAQRDGECQHMQMRAHAEGTIRALLHDLLNQCAPPRVEQVHLIEHSKAPEQVAEAQRSEQSSRACLAQCSCCNMSYQQHQQPECSPLSRSCFSALSLTSSAPSSVRKGTRDHTSSFRRTSSQLSSAASTAQHGGWTSRNGTVSINSSTAQRHIKASCCASQMSLRRAAQEAAACRSPLSVTGETPTPSIITVFKHCIGVKLLICTGLHYDACVLTYANTAASALTPAQRRARYSALADDQRQYLAEKLSVVVRVLAARSTVTAANDLADAWWRWKVSSC